MKKPTPERPHPSSPRTGSWPDRVKVRFEILATRPPPPCLPRTCFAKYFKNGGGVPAWRAVRKAGVNENVAQIVLIGNFATKGASKREANWHTSLQIESARMAARRKKGHLLGSSLLAHALPPGRYRTSVLLRLSYHELGELSSVFSRWVRSDCLALTRPPVPRL
jgi:hypothetical protein